MIVRSAFSLSIAALAAIILSGCSLAGDITPPPGSSGSRPPASTVAPASAPTDAAPALADSGLGYPSTTPSAANGAAVFAQHCAQCHGAKGAGDGPMAAQLQFPPANFSDPTLARSATPAKWFETISTGNLDRFMPPFARTRASTGVETLTEAERWDVTFFLFTLTAPQESVDKGKDIYAANCAKCHGDKGEGDGPEATTDRPLPDFADPAAMAAKSQSDLFTATTGGVGQAMPSFADSLTEDERWSLADYIRTFSYEYLAPGAKPIEAHGTIAGQVANGTAGGAQPAGLDVVLYGFDQFQMATTITETAKPDGSYIFQDVPYIPGRVFIVTTDYNGVSYSSEIASFDGETPTAPRVDAPLKVYEVTSDPAALRIDRMHVFFDFSSGDAVVGELFIIANGGDKTVTGGAGLLFDLPTGAANLRIQNATAGQDYVETPTGFTLVNPIPPGESAQQILASFSLPYDGKLAFSQKLPFAVTTANVLVPGLGVKVSSDQLQPGGVRDVQGTQFQNFNATNLAAGSTLSFNLSGGASAGGAAFVADRRNLIVGGFALAVVAGALGWWFYSRRASAPSAALPSGRNALAQAIADLDDAFDTGEVSQKEYKRRRARLKAKLIGQWDG